MNEGVTGVGLLDDSRHHLADPIAVLLEHHVALGFADPLEDHLLGGLGSDPAEVVRRDVPSTDLVLVLGKLLEIDLGLLRLAHLTRLRIDRLLLLDRLLDELLLQLGRDDQLEDTKIGGLAVHLDAGVLGGVRRLLVRGQQRVLEGEHELLRGDSLLALQSLYCLDYLLAHLTLQGKTVVVKRRGALNGNTRNA